MLRQKKVKPLGFYKKKFWKLFSEYIRRRDRGVCFTCGLTKHWKQQQAGHCIPKASGGLALYFDIINVNCQCFRCNINLGGNGAVYIEKIRERFGEGAVEYLFELKKERWKWTKDDYIERIEAYKEIMRLFCD